MASYIVLLRASAIENGAENAFDRGGGSYKVANATRFCQTNQNKRGYVFFLCHFGSWSWRGRRLVLGCYDYPEDEYAVNIEQGEGNSFSPIYIKCAQSMTQGL